MNPLCCVLEPHGVSCPLAKCHGYSRINSAESQTSGAGNVSEPRLMSHKLGECAKSCARRSVCVAAARAVGVSVLVCLRSSCSHVTEVGGP